jgi:hypothetical protein
VLSTLSSTIREGTNMSAEQDFQEKAKSADEVATEAAATSLDRPEGDDRPGSDADVELLDGISRALSEIGFFTADSDTIGRSAGSCGSAGC